MGQDPIPVRERTRRAVRGELAQLAVSLFVEKGYDETTIDDLAAAAGMSKRTFFRYFASKEELVMGKYEFFGQQLAEDLAARPAVPALQPRRMLVTVLGALVRGKPSRNLKRAQTRRGP